MNISKKLAIFCIFLLSATVSSHGSEPHICQHDSLEFNPQSADVEIEDFVSEGRLLQETTYPNIRIYTYFGLLTTGTTEFQSYIKNELVPPVVSLLQKALKIKYPLKTPLSITYDTFCGWPTPSILKTGVNADFFLSFVSKEDTQSSWVASAASCVVSTGLVRPIVASVLLNSAAIRPVTAESNPLGHEYNMYLMIHEILHSLGFSQNFHYNYVDSYGNLLKNHIKTVLLSGKNRTVLDLPPLTSRLRAHYGCSTLPGAFMENDGGSGTAGSHWERKLFPFDLLASGAIYGRRLTEFTLAFMEGTGWYVPDYSYAEPFYFGKGQGCNFVYDTCDPSVAKFDEFCTGNGRGCSPIGVTGGYCKNDICSDNCRFFSPQFEFHCENPNGVYYTPFSNLQVYGRGAGSKCFSGNLTTVGYGTVSQTSYCFKYNCVGTGLSTTLEVLLGTQKVVCTKEGPLKVTGYDGQIDCPDPLQYCSTIGKAYCPRGCSGRGQCIDNKCVCNTGFKGIDCAFRNI